MYFDALLFTDHIEEQQADVRKEMLQAKNNISFVVVRICDRVCFVYCCVYKWIVSYSYCKLHVPVVQDFLLYFVPCC